MFNFLRKIELFSKLPEDDLWQLCGLIETINISAGEVLFKEGDPGEKAYVIKEGELEVIKDGPGGEMLLAARKPGEVIGEMALLEENPRMATVRARRDSTLFAIEKEQIDNLIATSPTAAQALFKTILARWRSTQSKLRQSEKMAQLGTMTAGVAHELNNPAAAVKRAADQLEEALTEYLRAQKVLDVDQFKPEGLESYLALLEQARQGGSNPPQINSLTRSDRQDEAEDWLYGAGINEAWKYAPAVVDMNLDVRDLDRISQLFGMESLPSILDVLCSWFTINKLIRSVGLGAGRISEIVKALKSYAYLDQAPVQNVDVHQGLEDTILILGNKLKSGITIKREYAPNLPIIQAYGSELNQVWTNLIDNAIDAMGEQGVITLRTRAQDKWVVVAVEDNGEGIPEEIQSRVFDPFFTTKPPGVGTGLGLDISYNIVVQKHKGNINLSSQPGKTVFEVWLPVNFENGSDSETRNAHREGAEAEA
ncbi:MAG: sensor histidine kinase [Anaerolineales bacterium]|jgi:signal transduction histidine kinase